ncbi:MarR family winged helix-turn-helix transcriptional regulator [Actinomadura livida]|uniref:MarR family transcriptional regulator n=1 Tax=Actinomadura livida TaxID=79909 RepID=A0A7W7N1Y8_9ACTN|nr:MULTISPECIES: MarR family transcriptional regulator [Actinomadura]MBB4778460.1 DNA-binding MarR family transcriptional regulator [Actinomadura catellatispora]GGU24371.1 MarR family transcriptional regulator [Actinomadura livida]
MKAEADLIVRWRELATCYNAVACALERALQDAHGLTMSEYETLDRLVDLNSKKCRMQEVAAAMYLSQSALSRTVARLEKQGYVQRALCQNDRRGIFVELTDAGRRHHAEARETHLKILAEHLTPNP